jgi:hypothetical protein
MNLIQFLNGLFLNFICNFYLLKYILNISSDKDKQAVTVIIFKDSTFFLLDLTNYLKHGHNSRSLVLILLPCYQVPSIYFMDFRSDLFFINLYYTIN